MILRDHEAREAWRWAPYFSLAEIECRHCHALAVDHETMNRLVLVRAVLGQPMPVTSGYRCPTHNEAVSKTGPAGPHTTGRAVDIGVSGETALHLVAAAVAHGFTGIGVSQRGLNRFVHIDDLQAPAYPRPTLWSY